MTITALGLHLPELREHPQDEQRYHYSQDE